jgi:carbamoyl-phosphate synthase large subunit
MSSLAVPSVLFTSSGRRVELVRAFRDACTELDNTVRIIAVDCDPLAPTLGMASSFYLVPRLDDPSYIPALMEICRRENVRWIFPLIDPDIPVLNARRADLERLGVQVCTVSPDFTETVSDKWLTTTFFADLGLHVPQSWLPEDIDVAELNFPVFIKPRRGSAGEGSSSARNARELDFLLGRCADAIIQELVPGPEITCDVMADWEGEIFSVVLRRRIAVRGGEVMRAVTVKNEKIAQSCIVIAKNLQATGPITVQCMMNDGLAYFIEVNARMGGGIPLALAAGANFPLWFLSRGVGENAVAPVKGVYREGVYLTRFDESLFLTGEERDAIQRHRI